MLGCRREIVAESPYELLGVAPDASADEIQKAYRRLAKKSHPDLNPGDPKALDRFKAISSAYGLLSDPEKRARFDSGEIDASGAERPQPRYYRDFAADSAEQPYTSDAGFADFMDQDILAELLRRGSRPRAPMPGRDLRFRLSIEFLEAVNGTRKAVTLPNGQSLEINVPPGIDDGQVLRLVGRGEPGTGGAPPGNALIEIHVRPHRLFRREGDDIRLDLPVTLKEAVLGARIQVPTPTGPVMVSIPKGSNTGKVLRLKGKGAPRADGTHGDLYAALRVMLPDRPDAELEAFAEGWQAGSSYNPRQSMEA
jgi:DnaJ-class molecular chaperone